MNARFYRPRYFFLALCFMLLFFVSQGQFAYPALADEARRVYLGGIPIGLVLKPRGVIVAGTVPVETDMGRVIVSSPLQTGDLIEEIDGTQVNTAEDVHAALQKCEELAARVTVRRGTARLELTAPLVCEDISGAKRLGLQIKEDVSGVGTVTFIKEDGSFACLGHPINMLDGMPVPLDSGSCFDCRILGCVKGERGKAGELRGAFSSATPCGELYKNCLSGVYGKAENLKRGKQVVVADRRHVSVGRATIVSTVGESAEEYDIEIIKASPQNNVQDKGMILRVTDKRLLSKTGGIVQGMSGSPILQNGMLVGAVTHVFVSDPTKGYGIYADWMLAD